MNRVSSGRPNDRPIIGVLSQEVSHQLEKIYGAKKYKCFIAASYVKFIEGSGGRVVPIWINREREYYVDIMKKINGVFLPGGSTWFNQGGGYADAGEIILKIAKELNENNVYFPIWGTCLGMELFAYLWLDRKYDDFREDCNSHHQPSRLSFRGDWSKSKMYGAAPDEIIRSLSSHDVTYNYHRFCLTEERFKNFGLTSEWKILSTSDDKDGLKYISSMESMSYPFYGVQFHPEKICYEWISGKNIPHSPETIKTNRYFADFFVDECRKNRQSFDSLDEEKQSLIYNFPAVYTGKDGSVYEQCYLFEY